jgi:hypothetical protein
LPDDKSCSRGEKFHIFILYEFDLKTRTCPA